jgi:hypothetical protein
MSVDYMHPYIVSAGKDKLIKLWKFVDDIDSNNYNKVQEIATYKGHT